MASATVANRRADLVREGPGRRHSPFPFDGTSVVEDLAEEVLGTADFGLEKKSSGAACSTIAPSGHEHDAVGRTPCEAHLVSDHQHGHPSAARPVITFRTSLIISGSSALVGSSNSIHLRVHRQ